MKQKLPLLVACFLSLAAAVNAQQKDLSLDELVVTATKSDHKQSAIGSVVNVITSETLRRSEGQTLGQLLNNQPGVTVNGANSAPGSNQSVFLRGAGDGYAMIMIDGVVVYDPSQITTHFDLNLIPVDMIDHIEIVRGAASTLYGSGAVAGVINIITRREAKQAFNARLGVTGGSYGSLKENLGLSGKTARVDYQLSFTHSASRGFSSALDTTGNGRFDRDGFQNTALDANIGVHVTPHLLIRPFFRYSYEKGDLDANAYTDDADYTYDTRYAQGGFHSVYAIPEGSFNLVYSYNHTDRGYLNDSAAHGAYLHETDEARIQVTDAYFNYAISPHTELLTGVSFTASDLDQHSLSVSSFGPYESALSSDSTRSMLSSVYASLFISDTNGLNLQLGGRLNTHSVYGSNPTFNINPFYSFHGRHKIFINVASVFNAPSLYQLYSPYGDRSLQPEKGMSYEAGFETLPATGMKLRVTGFIRSMRDVIAFTDHYINFNRQKDHGAELEITYAWNNGLTLTGYYAYVDGKVTTETDQKRDTSYFNLFKRPRHSAGISLDYQVTPSFFAGTAVKYAGARKDQDFGTWPATVVTLQPYLLWNMHLAYTFGKRCRLFADINNITDTRYMENLGYATRRFNIDGGLQVTLF